MDITKENIHDYASKTSHEWWQVVMHKWNTLSDEEKKKYNNQFIGFNDFSDILMNELIRALEQVVFTGRLVYEEGSLAELTNDKFEVTIPKDAVDKLGIKTDLSNLKEVVEKTDWNNVTMEMKHNEELTENSQLQSLKRSFSKYNEGFPPEKQEYFDYIANALCKLNFTDNICSYNKIDSSIDIVLYLECGIKVCLSYFIDGDEIVPVLFLLYRNGKLLVSDEMFINDVVDKINYVIKTVKDDINKVLDIAAKTLGVECAPKPIKE